MPATQEFLIQIQLQIDYTYKQYSQNIYYNQISKPMNNITILLFLTVLRFADAQVLGIDFGTEFWKAALISPGKNLVIVENSRSQRKTLNSIAFHQGIRFFEDDSQSKRLKKPQLSYFYLNKLIRSLDDKQPVQGHKFIDGTYVFQDGDKEMSLQQVVAMILKNIKHLASLQAGTQIKDVVLSVPANWGFHSKMSLVNAASLADFSVLGLINENSAAAIQFAISRNDTDPINVMLFNYGSHNLQISIIKAFGYFDEQKNKTIQSIQALCHVTVQDVGGLKVDEQIANYLAQQFKKKHKVDPRTNRKSYTKLLIKSSDVKQTLSANKQTQVYAEGLIDGIDLNLHIHRQVVEGCKHFKQFPKYIEQALEKARLKKQDISSVQLIGGASRIPRVQAIVRQYFGESEQISVGSQINGDEAVAFGSALRAANLSLTFRVKQLHFYDPMNLDTKVIISSPDKGVILEQTLFHVSDHHGAKRTLSLNHNEEDIKITVYVGEEIVKEYSTKGVPQWKQKHKNDNVTEQPNLVIQLMMSSIHIADIKDIYLNVTVNVTSLKEKIEYVDEEVEIQVQVDDKKQTKNATQEGAKEQQQQQEGIETTKTEQQKKDTQQKQTKKQVEKQQKRKQKRKVNKTKTVKVQVEEHEVRPKKHIPASQQTFNKYKKYNKDEIQTRRKLLHQYQAHERQIKQKAKIRNDFQSALYGLKNNFEQKYLKTFSKQSQLSHLVQTVTKQLQWLDENAWTATKQLFEQHFQILTSAYNPIYNRTTEYRGRQKSYNESMGYLGMVYQKTGELMTTHSWIKQKIQEHLRKINQTAEWIGSKIKQQIDRPLNENPILFNHQMIQKAEELRNQYYKLKMIPRPKIDDLLKDLKKKMEEEEKNKNKEPSQKKQQEEKKQQNEQKQQENQQNSQDEQKQLNAQEPIQKQKKTNQEL